MQKGWIDDALKQKKESPASTGRAKQLTHYFLKKEQEKVVVKNKAMLIAKKISLPPRLFLPLLLLLAQLQRAQNVIVPGGCFYLQG